METMKYAWEKRDGHWSLVPTRPPPEDGIILTSMADLMDAGERPPAETGDYWGPWILFADSRTIEHRKSGYWIGLPEITTATEALDWIAQVSKKTWASRADVGDLVDLLEDLLDLQWMVHGTPPDLSKTVASVKP